MNELTTTGQITAVDAEKTAIEFLDLQGKTQDLLPSEKKMFVGIAREYGLNPFKREIHITAYGQGDRRKCSIITGYEVYIKRAERTGKLDGWESGVSGEGKNMKAFVKIYRKDWKYPFHHEVRYSECVQLNKDGYPNSVWAKQPSFMLRKVAIGQAFRLCFSDDLGGMPYEEAEMPQEERNVTPEDAADTISENGAASPSQNPEGEKKPLTDRRAEILKEMGKIMTAVNPDNLPYFSEIEKKTEKGIISKTENNSELEAQLSDMKTVLAERIAAFKPVPFDDGFKDDIPGEKQDSIF